MKICWTWDLISTFKKIKNEKMDRITCFIEHFVTLVEDKHLKVVEFEDVSIHQGKDSSWGADDDMGALFLILEELLVLMHWNASEDDGASELR